MSPCSEETASSVVRTCFLSLVSGRVDVSIMSSVIEMTGKSRKTTQAKAIRPALRFSWGILWTAHQSTRATATPSQTRLRTNSKGPTMEIVSRKTLPGQQSRGCVTGRNPGVWADGFYQCKAWLSTGAPALSRWLDTAESAIIGESPPPQAPRPTAAQMSFGGRDRLRRHRRP